MKITYLGKDITRTRKGRFTSFTSSLKKILRRSALVCALGWIVFGSYSVGAFDRARTLVAYAGDSTSTVPVINQYKNIEQLKDDVVAKLSHDENADPDKVPFKWDDNSKGTLPAKDKPSYGCMQFKNSTVQRFYKAIYGESLTNLQAVVLALDCPKAQALAREAIFGKLNAIGEWSAATPDMKMEVKVIRKMSL